MDVVPPKPAPAQEPKAVQPLVVEPKLAAPNRKIETLKSPEQTFSKPAVAVAKKSGGTNRAIAIALVCFVGLSSLAFYVYLKAN